LHYSALDTHCAALAAVKTLLKRRELERNARELLCNAQFW